MNSRGFNGVVFREACIRFNESFSLLDINWKLEPGQVWAILGASGSGKSALAAALTGTGELSSGTLELQDRVFHLKPVVYMHQF